MVIILERFGQQFKISSYYTFFKHLVAISASRILLSSSARNARDEIVPCVCTTPMNVMRRIRNNLVTEISYIIVFKPK